LRVAIGQAAQDPGGLGVRLGGDLERGERVPLVRVESRRDQHELRIELLGGR